MSDLLHDPFIQASLLPLLLGLAAVGVLRAAGGAGLAAAGIAAAFALLFALVVGVPALPPPSSMGKLFWTAVLGLVLGAAADGLRLPGRAGSVLVLVWLVGSILWIALPALEAAAAVPLAVLAGLALWVAFADAPAPLSSAAAPAPVLLAFALAVGGTALIGSSASLAQLGFGLAAATGGFLLWNWPVERHGWGVSGRVALALPLLLATILALFTQAQTATLLLTLPSLLAGRLARRLPRPAGRAGDAVAAAAVTVLALLPALAALGAAYLLTESDPSPY